MNQSAGVVIIGGGIQGASLAYHLAQQGLTDVVLVERDLLGSGSSGRSAAIIGHALRTDLGLPLTQWSFQAILRFRQELDADPGYRPIGCLLFAAPEGLRELSRRHALMLEMGVASHLVDPAGIARLTPHLNLEGVAGGLYLPHGGVLDPHSILMAYAGHARRMGVRILERVRATGLQTQAGRVTGVSTSDGPIATPCVVNAAGAYARQVGAWAGLDLPITNLRRHILVTAPVAAYAGPFPFTYEWEQAWYLRREGPGVLLGMGEDPEGGPDAPVDRGELEALVDYSVYRAPRLADAGLMTCWAGIRPVTPDEDPILGPVPSLEGYINDCGWGGHGVMDAPAAGMALAELITTGAAASLDITPFFSDRFDGGQMGPDR